MAVIGDEHQQMNREMNIDKQKKKKKTLNSFYTKAQRHRGQQKSVKHLYGHCIIKWIFGFVCGVY